MKVLELYSGIGGMHLALRASQVPAEVIASIDINTVANEVYKHNFPYTKLLNRNIQNLDANFIKKLRVDTILMSPPCQPFTRNGLKKDVDDARTCSFIHVINLLPEISIDRILIENVKGFEKSEMRDRLVQGLTLAGFLFQEYILSPSQIGVPNTRHRYYCLAKKDFGWKTTGKLEVQFPEISGCFNEPFEINSILEENIDINKYALPDKVLLKRSKIIDICYSISTRSCCFTKAYGRYVEGTGSVYTDKKQEEVADVFKNLEDYSENSIEYLKHISKLNLRFFTPKEVSRLMSFPEDFSFPDSVTIRQRYQLLGNSINIKVVSELIKELFNSLFCFISSS